MSISEYVLQKRSSIRTTIDMNGEPHYELEWQIKPATTTSPRPTPSSRSITSSTGNTAAPRHPQPRRFCSFHHHRKHDGSFDVTGNADQPNGLVFTRPDGSTIRPARADHSCRAIAVTTTRTPLHPPHRRTPPTEVGPLQHPPQSRLTARLLRNEAEVNEARSLNTPLSRAGEVRRCARHRVGA